MFLGLWNRENYTVANEQSGKNPRTKEHKFSQAQTSEESSKVYNVVVMLNKLEDRITTTVNPTESVRERKWEQEDL